MLCYARKREDRNEDDDCSSRHRGFLILIIFGIFRGKHDDVIEVMREDEDKHRVTCISPQRGMEVAQDP